MRVSFSVYVAFSIPSGSAHSNELINRLVGESQIYIRLELTSWIIPGILIRRSATYLRVWLQAYDLSCVTSSE